jgi:hypothetical protein
VTRSRSARARARRIRRRRLRAVGVLVLIAATAAALGDQVPGFSSSTASSSPSPAADGPVDAPRSEHRRRLGEADGAVPDGTTVFDDDVPGVAKLDPDLLAAVRQASTDSGIEFLVDSGWRSAAYQAHLLQEAIQKYGSRSEAARWVATPDTSEHVSGDAVDIGPVAAAGWLSQHGAAYGLCQIYGNEPWHYELRPEAAGQGCPPMYADPTDDPRMQK